MRCYYNTIISATVFSTVYIRVELLLGSFCNFIITKTKRIANFANPSSLVCQKQVIMSHWNTSKKVPNNNVIFSRSSLLFLFRLWYTLSVESFKAVAISIKVGDAYGRLYKIYRKEVALCQSMKRWHWCVLLRLY